MRIILLILILNAFGDKLPPPYGQELYNKKAAFYSLGDIDRQKADLEYNS